MRIDSSVLQMESSRRYTSVSARSTRFQVKSGSGEDAHRTGTFSGSMLLADDGSFLEANGWHAAKRDTGQEEPDKTASVDSIDELRSRVESMRGSRISVRSSTQEVFHRFRQQAIRSIFAMLFGAEKAKSVFDDFDAEQSVTSTQVSGISSIGTGNNLVLTKEQYYEENESTSFTTSGLVRTADGREISIHMEVGMSRRFSSYYQEELQIAGINTCDPLVLNFEGSAAELTDQKFFFDIDADGVKDEVSMLGSGSGYLALDRNQDGVINDGSELFGPQSGSGFSELAAYDQDGNGWIDENDAVWSKLKIWCKNSDGTDALYTLAEKGVGAICLNSTDTEFSLKGAENRTNGIIRSTGFFLYESGETGTVQHLDLAR